MQPSLFDDQRMNWSEAMDITTASLNAYAKNYRHWAIAYSGGKDSTATLSAVV